MRAGLGGKLTRGQGLGSRGAVAAGVAPPPPSVTQYVRPISNANTLWFSNAYTSINDDVTQPTVPSSGTVQANKNDDNEAQQWNIGLGEAGSYASLKLWVYGRRVGSAPDIEADLIVNGAAQGQTALSLTTSDSWKYVAFTGPFTLPLSSLVAELTAGVIVGGGDSVLINAVYVEAVPA